jgi:hypothetical protein
LCSHLIVSQHFMEPEGSLPHSLVSDLRQTNPVHTASTYHYKIHLIVMLSFLFLRLGPSSKESVQVQGSFLCFVTGLFYGEGLSAPRPIPKLEDHPLSYVRSCLFNVFAANLHSWRPSLYPRPEDAPSCGDRDPPNMDRKYILKTKYS